jgi:hypothetical protein
MHLTLDDGLIKSYNQQLTRLHDILFGCAVSAAKDSKIECEKNGNFTMKSVYINTGVIQGMIVAT